MMTEREKRRRALETAMGGKKHLIPFVSDIELITSKATRYCTFCGDAILRGEKLYARSTYYGNLNICTTCAFLTPETIERRRLEVEARVPRKNKYKGYK